MTTDDPIEPVDPPPNTPPREPLSAREDGPTFAAAQPHVKDLSEEIAKALPRAPGERVTCRWIAGNQYRCNWWGPANAGGYDNPGMGGLTVTTHRVRHSQWVHVTKYGHALLIDPPPRAVR